MGSGANISLVFASMFVTGALLCIALSFATDHWVETIIQRTDLKAKAAKDSNTALQNDLKTNPLYFTRYRGMFRTCYPGNETIFLDKNPNAVDGGCIIETGYELDSEKRTNFEDEYEIRIHLMRSHFGFFVFSLLFLVIAAILGAVGCWRMSSKVLRATGLVAFFGAFFALGGMAFFHGYEYMENQQLKSEQFPGYWQSAAKYKALEDHYYIQYGYSYMLGWIGVGLAAISAILFLCAAMMVPDAYPEDAGPLEMKKSSRNRAYDYMAQQPQFIQPPPPQHAPSVMYGEYAPQPQYVVAPPSMGQPMGYDYGQYGRY